MAYSNNNYSGGYTGGYGGEYTTTSYGAQGGAGGGGFMAQSQPEGSQQAPRDKYGQDTLRPCTILQVLSAERIGDEFHVDGTEVGAISIVGQIRAVSRQALGLLYTLDDGTGVIEGREWQSSDNATHDEDGNALGADGGGGGGNSSPALEVGQWVKVFAVPRQLGNQQKRNLTIRAIRVLHDKNAISHHLLEATAIHLYYTRGPPGGAGGAAGGGGAGASGADAGGDSLFVKQDPNDTMSGLSALARRMLLWMKRQEQNNEGYHAQVISAQTGMSFAEVINAGEELNNTGKICATLDDQTWQVLE